MMFFPVPNLHPQRLVHWGKKVLYTAARHFIYRSPTLHILQPDTPCISARYFIYLSPTLHIAQPDTSYTLARHFIYLSPTLLIPQPDTSYTAAGHRYTQLASTEESGRLAEYTCDGLRYMELHVGCILCRAAAYGAAYRGIHVSGGGILSCI